MRHYNPREKLISLHVHKCGGTSFRRTLQWWFLLGFHAHYYLPEKQQPPKPIPAWKKRLSPVLPLCVHGHFPNNERVGLHKYYPEARQFISMLRDPLELEISNYNYIRKCFEAGTLYDANGRVIRQLPFGSLEEFFEGRQSKILHDLPFAWSEDTYQSLVEEHFVHIGVLERLQDSIDLLAQKLGKRPRKMPHSNISGSALRPPQTVAKTFEANNPLVFKLYHYALELNRPQKEI